MSQQTETIRNLVANAEPLKAAQMLQEFAEGLVATDAVAEGQIRDARQEAIVHLASLNAVRKAARRYEIEQDEADRRIARVSHAILELLLVLEGLTDRADV